MSMFIAQSYHERTLDIVLVIVHIVGEDSN